MINIKALAKQYQHLSEKERALLMINADMNEDEQEFQRLKASAPVKHFRIVGDRESEIGNAWQQVHKDFLVCKNFLLRKLLTTVLGDKNFQSCGELFLIEMRALDLAFVDVLKTHDLPINQPFLKAFNCEPNVKEWEQAKIEDIKQGEFYQGYSELFEATCKAAL